MKKTKTEDLSYHVRLSVTKAVHDRIKAQAEKRGETQNAFIRRIVKNHLDHKKTV
jgi:predicted DNA-binding protein